MIEESLHAGHARRMTRVAWVISILQIDDAFGSGGLDERDDRRLDNDAE